MGHGRKAFSRKGIFLLHCTWERRKLKAAAQQLVADVKQTFCSLSIYGISWSFFLGWSFSIMMMGVEKEQSQIGGEIDDTRPSNDREIPWKKSPSRFLQDDDKIWHCLQRTRFSFSIQRHWKRHHLHGRIFWIFGSGHRIFGNHPTSCLDLWKWRVGISWFCHSRKDRLDGEPLFTRHWLLGRIWDTLFISGMDLNKPVAKSQQFPLIGTSFGRVFTNLLLSPRRRRVMTKFHLLFMAAQAPSLEQPGNSLWLIVRDPSSFLKANVTGSSPRLVMGKFHHHKCPWFFLCFWPGISCAERRKIWASTAQKLDPTGIFKQLRRVSRI